MTEPVLVRCEACVGRGRRWKWGKFRVCEQCKGKGEIEVLKLP